MKTLVLSSEDLNAEHPLLDSPWPVVVAMPYTDRSMAERAVHLMASRAGLEEALLVAVEDVERAGFINTANQAFERTRSDFFGYAAQDAFPGRQWLSRAMNALMTRNKDFLGFNDGKWMGALASFGLARRSWAQTNYGGALFFPGYHSHYGDVELTLLAMNEQSYCYDPNSVLVEVDWGKDEAATLSLDKLCFKERVRQRFGNKVSKPELLNLFG